MKDTQDLAVPDNDEPLYTPLLLPAGQGSIVPPLSKEIQALIVLANAEAHWAWNFWVVTARSGVKSHLHEGATFEEWHAKVAPP